MENVTAFRPRGIRNNNPGNIRRNHIDWQGMTRGADTRFVTFSEPVWGLRALMKVLLSYYRKHSLNTVETIVTRWAPPRENATAHYVEFVSQWVGMRPDDPLDMENRDTLIDLARAITVQENGRPPEGSPHSWYPYDLYRRAAALALGETAAPT